MRERSNGDGHGQPAHCEPGATHPSPLIQEDRDLHARCGLQSPDSLAIVLQHETLGRVSHRLLPIHYFK